MIDLLGWVGAAIILAMFACNSSGIQIGNLLYHALNFFGSTLAGTASYNAKAWPAALINTCRAITSVIFIIRDLT